MISKFAHRIVRSLGHKDAENVDCEAQIDCDHLLVVESFTRLLLRFGSDEPSLPYVHQRSIIPKSGHLQCCTNIADRDALGNRFTHFQRTTNEALLPRECVFINKCSHVRLDGLLKAHHKELRFSRSSTKRSFGDDEFFIEKIFALQINSWKPFRGCSRSQGPIFGWRNEVGIIDGALPGDISHFSGDGIRQV